MTFLKNGIINVFVPITLFFAIGSCSGPHEKITNDNIARKTNATDASVCINDRRATVELTGQFFNGPALRKNAIVFALFAYDEIKENEDFDSLSINFHGGNEAAFTYATSELDIVISIVNNAGVLCQAIQQENYEGIKKTLAPEIAKNDSLVSSLYLLVAHVFNQFGKPGEYSFESFEPYFGSSGKTDAYVVVFIFRTNRDIYFPCQIIFDGNASNLWIRDFRFGNGTTLPKA